MNHRFDCLAPTLTISPCFRMLRFALKERKVYGR